MLGDRALVPVEIRGRTYYIECESVAHPAGGEQWDIDLGALVTPIESVADEYLVEDAACNQAFELHRQKGWR